MQYRWTLFLLLLAPVLGSAQIMFPGGGVGVTPPWMRGRKTITGHIGDIDGTKVMVKTLDAGNVLFTVDDKTKIHIDKTKLALADLKVEDAVMVELKELKDKSQYATEIVPHPDVLARKQRGGTPDALPTATDLPPSPPVEAPESAGPAVKLGSTPVSTASAAPPVASLSSVAIPAVPRGESGITGTI